MPTGGINHPLILGQHVRTTSSGKVPPATQQRSLSVGIIMHSPTSQPLRCAQPRWQSVTGHGASDAKCARQSPEQASKRAFRCTTFPVPPLAVLARLGCDAGSGCGKEGPHFALPKSSFSPSAPAWWDLSLFQHPSSTATTVDARSARIYAGQVGSGNGF